MVHESSFCEYQRTGARNLALNGVDVRRRTNDILKEVFRKSIHLCTAFVPIMLKYFYLPTIILLSVVLVLYIVAESLRYKGINVPVISAITKAAARKRDENRFECTALIQANRPVYNSAYNSTLYNNRDANFNFDFQQFDQLNFVEENIDNQLTALLAYYAMLIIGLDLDSFSPMGGTDVLQRCMVLVNNAQNLGFAGWKSFEDNRNRFAIINDYLDEAMKPFRQLQYDYYRKGLDEMANNAERGRTEISTALENDLQKAHSDKPLSILPQIWTDYKKDELVNIYKGKGTQKEKQRIYDLLMGLNASQNNSWEQITK